MASPQRDTVKIALAMLCRLHAPRSGLNVLLHASLLGVGVGSHLSWVFPKLSITAASDRICDE